MESGMMVRVRVVVMRLWRDICDCKVGIVAFIVYYIVVHAVFHAFCPSVILTGLPCAGCGMTRAVFLLTGQFGRSWRIHPMAFPVLLFLFYCVIMRYILGRRIKGLKTGIVILCLCMLAVYGYRMCMVFPDRAPYVYTAGNLLEKQVPFYRELLHKLFGI